jgi:hypothetical protein
MPQTLPNLRNSYAPDEPAKVGLECTYGELCMCTQASQLEIQTPTPWKPIGRSKTPVLSPSSILPPPSSQNVLTPAKKNTAHV